MFKGKKKFIAVLLAALMLFTVVTVFAACGEEEEARYDYFSFTHSADLGGLVVSVKSKTTLPEAVTIPSNYYADTDTAHATKIAVVGIADEAFMDLPIKSIVLPATMRSIGKSAFKGCSALTGIDFTGEQAKSIGKSAFYGCHKLQTVALADTITVIEDDTFSYCTMLKSISGGKIEKIGNNAFLCNLSLMDISKFDTSGVKSIGSRAFFYTVCITEFNVPSGCSTHADSFEGWTDSQKLNKY